MATSYTWWPDKIDLLNGMALGAGLGAAVGGTIALILRARVPKSMTSIGTVVGIVVGGVAVVLGNVGADITDLGGPPSTVLIGAVIWAVLKSLPNALTGWTAREKARDDGVTPAHRQAPAQPPISRESE